MGGVIVYISSPKLLRFEVRTLYGGTDHVFLPTGKNSSRTSEEVFRLEPGSWASGGLRQFSWASGESSHTCSRCGCKFGGYIVFFDVSCETSTELRRWDR